MTQAAIASSTSLGSKAGAELGAQISQQFAGAIPDVVIVFASPQNDYAALLQALHDGCSPKLLAGCSSAGEFTDDTSGTGMSSAIALRSDDIQFSAACADGLGKDPGGAAEALLRGFKGIDDQEYRYHTALLLVDALAGHTEELVDRLTIETGGHYRFVGGGAGDDGRFSQTHVFLGTEVHSDAAVAIEMLSNKPIGIGARHGWQPASAPLRVTESNATTVVSLNVSPAVEVFEEHATATKQEFKRDDPLPFFLHNIVGVQTPEGHKLRVPLGVGEDGGVLCAADVPTGATAHIMGTGGESAAQAATEATRDAIQQVRSAGHEPGAAIFLDCVATRLRLGQSFEDELDAVRKELGAAPFAGFNSYGQIVRSDGQFSGFHNCTAVVCVFPQ